VFSPLKSLIQDQVTNLCGKGIVASRLDSDQVNFKMVCVAVWRSAWARTKAASDECPSVLCRYRVACPLPFSDLLLVLWMHIDSDTKSNHDIGRLYRR
jgi:hypothetical protein